MPPPNMQVQGVHLDPPIQGHGAHDGSWRPSEQTREPTPESGGFSDTLIMAATELHNSR